MPVEKPEAHWCSSSHLADINTRDHILDVMSATMVVKPQLISARQTTRFPVTRRPQFRPLSIATYEEVHQWFEDSGITIGEWADTPRRCQQAEYLFYTWNDCFAKSMADVKPTDLIEHAIDLIPKARPMYAKLSKYT